MVPWRENSDTLRRFRRQTRSSAAGHIATEAARDLILDLKGQLPAWGVDPSFDMIPGVQYRHLLVQRGGASSPEAGFAIRPPHDITNQPFAPDWDVYASSPRLMDLLARAADHLARPGNPTKASALWPWGQGRALHLPSFRETYGLNGAVISAVDLVRGLGRAAGMAVLAVEGVTGLLDTNYAGKVQAALDFLDQGGDYVFLHVEAPDECGHAGNVADKVESIARFDARVVAPIRRALAGQSAALVVACDHLTPLAIRTHSPDPVPFLFWRADDATSGPAAFSESTAAASGLALETGHGLLAWTLEQARR